MRRCCEIAFVVLVLVLVAGPANAAGTEVEIADLIADESAFSGQEIAVSGELVGDYGRRRDGTVWTQLNGDPYAVAPLLEGGDLSGSNAGIGVRLPASETESLDRPGGYRRRGPLVRLTGVWRYHDVDRGGESFLDVTELLVIEPGRTLTDDVPWWAAVAGLVLTAAGVAWRVRTRFVLDRTRGSRSRRQALPEPDETS
jgi:hypothetical protein